MTAPDRIWAKDRYGTWGSLGDWYADGKGGGTEYARRDPAVLAALPEVQALVADAVKVERDRIAAKVQRYGEGSGRAQCKRDCDALAAAIRGGDA